MHPSLVSPHPALPRRARAGYRPFPDRVSEAVPAGDSRAAFSLVEVVLAIGIAAFAILTIIGLLGTALKSNTDSEERIQAANIATTLLVQYREYLNDPTGRTWDNPLTQAAVGTSPPADFGSPQFISTDGKTVSTDDAAYALSWAIWKDQTLASSDAPYDLVNCSLRFQWPPRAVTGGSDNARVDSYDVTTSFLIDKNPTTP